ncbi:uncharacterized protein LOC134155747 [Pezoporus occidentalis]|uniref:uncharacterized protein LOC134155747 n=1 Tax=Pezoporus occidentalis TaxID=407982 RepID=UPI002F90CFE9
MAVTPHCPELRQGVSGAQHSSGWCGWRWGKFPEHCWTLGLPAAQGLLCSIQHRASSQLCGAASPSEHLRYPQSHPHAVSESCLFPPDVQSVSVRLSQALTPPASLPCLMEQGFWQRWLLLLVGIQLASGQCPEQCQCVRTAQVECSGAGITTVPSPIPENAMTLQIINTLITELGDASFGNASLLIGLRIEKNNLSRISPRAFQHLPDLRYLSLSSNKLQELPVQVFEPLGKLESLLLSSNQILQVEPSHFSHLSNLKELQLHGNNLQELKEGVFDHLTSLTKLNLARNDIDHLPRRAFERLARLQVLRLYENRLRQIPVGTFDGLPELQELGLHQNQLETLSPELFVHNGNLQKLYLSNNLLVTLPSGVFLPLRALAKITLHVNRLRDISPGAFGPMPNLRELWLYDNELSTLPTAVFGNLTQLQLLVLSKNRLRSVARGAFQGLGELLELSLHSNALRRLDAQTLEGMPKLQNISLHHNQLQMLPRGLFSTTPGLRHLQLHSNALEYLPAGIFSPLAALQEVKLHNNSWRCDEGILPLRGWLEDNLHKVGETPPLCAQPPSLWGTPIAGLPQDQLLVPVPSTASPRPSTPLPAGPSEVALPEGAWTEPPMGLPVSPQADEEKEEEEERGQWGLTSTQSGVVVAVIVLVCAALLAALVALVVYGCRKKSQVVLMRMKAPNEASPPASVLIPCPGASSCDAERGPLKQRATAWSFMMVLNSNRTPLSLTLLCPLWCYLSFHRLLPAAPAMPQPLPPPGQEPHTRCCRALADGLGAAAGLAHPHRSTLPPCPQAASTFPGPHSLLPPPAASPVPRGVRDTGLCCVRGNYRHLLSLCGWVIFEALQGRRLLLPISSEGQLRLSRHSSLQVSHLPQKTLFHLGEQPPCKPAVGCVVVSTMLHSAGDEARLLLQCRLVVYMLLGLGFLLVRGLPLPCPSSCQCYDTSKVFCSEERMREIPVGLPGNATQLFFVETALRSVRSGALGFSTTLTKLVFLNNNIQDLEDGAFQGLPGLTELEVSGNPLPAVSPRLLAGLPSLSKLSLGANALRSLQPGLFASACCLQDLRLPGNRIEALPPGIFRPLRHLQTLDLSQNVLTELPAELLAPLTALRLLKLSDNLLARLPHGAFGALGLLAELHLDGNRLEELPANAFAGLGALRRLQLQHNALGSLSPDIFTGLPNLTVLSLEGNRLATLPATLFTGTPRLLHLSLARNGLEMLPQGLFANLSVLQTLVLSYNSIDHLPAGVFQGLAELATLHLSHNNLSSLPAGLLRGLPLLTALALDHNRLARLPPGLFDANEELVRVGLGSNPWVCDCHLAYLLSWLQGFAEPLTHAQASCASPAALQGRSLLEVPHRQLQCPGASGATPEEGWNGEHGPGQCTYRNPEGTVSMACDATSCQQLSLHLPPPSPPPRQAAGLGPVYQGAWVLHSRCGTLQVNVLVTAQSRDEATSPGLPTVP